MGPAALDADMLGYFFPNRSGECFLSQHITRKELKQDRIRESLEHGAEAVASHTRFVTTALIAAALVVAAWGAWHFYSERRNVKASAALDEAMKIYNARIRAAGEPAESGEITYLDEPTKMEAAATKFIDVADKYPRTDAGRLARYYAALSLEESNRTNQALENLKKLEGTRDKELGALAQYQTALIYARTGKPDDAVKALRALA